MDPSGSEKSSRRPYQDKRFITWVSQIEREWGLQFFLEALRETEPVDQTTFYSTVRKREREKVLEKVWKEIPF